jgi:hypothetical protein
MSWLNKLFTPQARPLAPSPSTGFFDIEGQPMPLDLEGKDIRPIRESIRSAGVHVAAAFGIPSNWLSYEVVTISDETKAYFQLQVSMRIWDEHLWSQSTAFEQQVMKHLREQNVQLSRAVRAVLWRVLPDAGCPYDELANEAAWRGEAIKRRAQAYDCIRQEFAPSAVAALAAGLPSDTLGAATQPVIRLENDSLYDTRPSSFDGFAATRPMNSGEFAPTEVQALPKNPS